MLQPNVHIHNWRFAATMSGDRMMCQCVECKATFVDDVPHMVAESLLNARVTSTRTLDGRYASADVFKVS